MKPYTLGDLVAGLNAVAPYDWQGHLARRVATPAEAAPLEGLYGGGWKLAFGDGASGYHKGQDRVNKTLDLTPSLGLLLTPEGEVTDVVRGKAAHQAGVGPGMKLVAVNGRAYTAGVLTTAVADTRKGGKLELLFRSGDFFTTHALDYKEGAKYPQLERDEGRADLLSKILKPLTPAAGK